MKKIAILGTGYVGLVSGTCFADTGNEVTCCDTDQDKIAKLLQGIMPIYEIYEPGLKELVAKNLKRGTLHFSIDIPEAITRAKIIFISVGTPMMVTGEADLTYIKQVAKMIGQHLNEYKVIVTKSTVSVGPGRLIASIGI